MGDKELKGAFIDACEHVINKDFELKKEMLKYLIDADLPITGVEVAELIFGDYIEFCKKFEGLK